jgi:UDP-perosamine 4-acetyltransferase
VNTLLLVGGGGHAKVVLDVARAAGFLVAGFLDPDPAAPSIGEIRRLGGDEAAPALRAQGLSLAFVALGDNRLRRKIGERLRAQGFGLAMLVHPSAVVSPSASIGSGTVVMPLAVVNAAARIGDHVIVNTGAIVEHDCMLGDGVHVAPRSALGGGCTLGEEVFFGIGACARPLSRIGAGATVGAGTVVVAEIMEGAIVVGTPARPLTRAYARSAP